MLRRCTRTSRRLLTRRLRPFSCTDLSTCCTDLSIFLHRFIHDFYRPGGSNRLDYAGRIIRASSLLAHQRVARSGATNHRGPQSNPRQRGKPVPKADYTYNHVRSRREIMGLLRHWEPKLRACGSDWESGIPGHIRYRMLRVANSMLRVLEREYPDSRPGYSKQLGRNSTAATGHLDINDMPTRADTPAALLGGFFPAFAGEKRDYRDQSAVRSGCGAQAPTSPVILAGTVEGRGGGSRTDRA
jgi:hypothetical protein